METRATMRVYVCINQECRNQGLYSMLHREVSRRSLPVILEETECLGQCSYLQRVDVRLPGGKLIKYAGTDIVWGDQRIFTAIGDDPLKTILDANLPKVAEGKK